MALVLIAGLITLNFGLGVLDLGFELLLFVVELVLQGQEVLIQGDAVAQERFIPASLIFLVHLSVLQELDLMLHSGDLLVEVQDDILVDGVRLAVLLAPLRQRLDFIGRLLQLGVTFVLLVDDRSRVPVVDVEVARGKLHVTGARC